MLKLFHVYASSSTLAHLPSDGEPFRKSFSSTTQVSELHQAVRQIFKLNGESSKCLRTRLWQVQINPDRLAQAQAQAESQAPAAEEDQIDPSLDEPGSEPSTRTATRRLPSHLISALSGKFISSDSSPTDGKGPMLSDIDIEDADCVALEIADETASGLQWPLKLNEAGMAEEVPQPQLSRPVAPAPLFSQPAMFSGEPSRASSSAFGAKKQEAPVEKKRQPRGLKGLTNLGVSSESTKIARSRRAELFLSVAEHMLHEQRAAVLVKYEGIERVFPT